jgi:sec-independent protein translocase protein TatC
MSEPHDPFAESRMSLVEHLTELRKRLMYVLGVLIVATFVAFSYAPELFTFLRQPLDVATTGQKLVVLSPLEMVFTYMKLSILAAVFGTAPWVLLQLWLFVAPGLYAHEKRWIAPFIIMGTLSFIGGGAFGFYVVIPNMFKYLTAMVPVGVENNYSVETYFNLVFHMLLAFGFVFELPLVMWILSAAGLVQAASFAKWRKYWVVASFIIGGVVTADPSPVSMCLMAVPLVLFWELGILGARIVQRKRTAANVAQASASSPAR